MYLSMKIYEKIIQFIFTFQAYEVMHPSAHCPPSQMNLNGCFEVPKQQMQQMYIERVNAPAVTVAVYQPKFEGYDDSCRAESRPPPFLSNQIEILISDDTSPSTSSIDAPIKMICEVCGDISFGKHYGYLQI